MVNLKSQLERVLLANLLIDKCKLSKNVIIEESWCTQDRIVRFTTKNLRAMYPTVVEFGFDKTGEIALYELNNEKPGHLHLSCRTYTTNIPKTYQLVVEEDQLDIFNIDYDYIKSDDAIMWFVYMLEDIIPQVEKECILEAVGDAQTEVLVEGAARSFASTRYERNRKAREICLAYHGKTCKVCGLNFERDYGAAFSDVIEVHHIVPISKIAESYIVDPIEDLVPVCPNCHTAIHSKKENTLTIEELLRSVQKIKG